MKVVLATGNAGKVREFAEMLAPLELHFVAQGALGIESAEETGQTFADNALLAARSWKQLSEMLFLVQEKASKCGLELHTHKTKSFHRQTEKIGAETGTVR